MIFDIILESVFHILKNIKKYIRHIVAIFLSIAVIIIMQCIEHSAISKIIMTDIGDDTNSKTITVSVANTENTNINMNEENIPDPFLIEYSKIKKLLEDNHAVILQSDILDKGRIVSGVTDVKVNIMQCSPYYLEKLLYGKLCDVEDENKKPIISSAAVISGQAADMLWGECDISGNTISLYTLNHGIIDVIIVGKVYGYDEVYDEMNDEYTSTIYVNSEIFQLSENNSNRLISELEFVLNSEYDEEEIISLIHQEFDGKYYGTPWELEFEYEDFTTGTSVDSVVKIIGVFIGFFAVLAFLISNIGLMNMRIISVEERLKEIGIRKAIGAENRHVSIQIIAESVTLSIIGAIIGVVSGFLISIVILFIMYNIYRDIMNTFELYIPIRSTIIAMIITFVVSLIFSLVPARKASKLVVIEAIRNQD